MTQAQLPQSKHKPEAKPAEVAMAGDLFVQK
jgi:hypothetical protein